jgi:hypothetical protein
MAHTKHRLAVYGAVSVYPAQPSTPTAVPPLADRLATPLVDPSPSTPQDELAAAVPPILEGEPQDVPTPAPRRPDPARGDVYYTREGRYWFRVERQAPTLPLSANVRNWSQEGDAEWTYPVKGKT